MSESSEEMQNLIEGFAKIHEDYPFETDYLALSDEQAKAICEILGLDAEKINSITLDADTMRVTIKRLKKSFAGE